MQKPKRPGYHREVRPISLSSGEFPYEADSATALGDSCRTLLLKVDEATALEPIPSSRAESHWRLGLGDLSDAGVNCVLAIQNLAQRATYLTNADRSMRAAASEINLAIEQLTG